jgi:biopolymer transport protein ExbD
MKFPRNARIFRGQLDVAPFAILFFLLVLFLMLGSLVYTPGVRLRLPVVDGLSGTDKPTLAVAVDANGRLYFENQVIDEQRLSERLREAVRITPGLALLVQADEAVPYKRLIQLTVLAQHAGISESWLATLPRPLASSP